MKKALALILALALSLSLFGCSPAEAPEDSPNAGGDGTQASAGAFVGNESDEYYMVSFLSGIDYWKHCFEGMEDAGNALGVTTSIPAKPTLMWPVRWLFWSRSLPRVPRASQSPA